MIRRCPEHWGGQDPPWKEEGRNKGMYRFVLAVCAGGMAGILFLVALFWERRDLGSEEERTPPVRAGIADSGEEVSSAARPGECRSFSVDRTTGGTTERLYGTACLGEDGQWRLK